MFFVRIAHSHTITFACLCFHVCLQRTEGGGSTCVTGGLIFANRAPPIPLGFRPVAGPVLIFRSYFTENEARGNVCFVLASKQEVTDGRSVSRPLRLILWFMSRNSRHARLTVRDLVLIRLGLWKMLQGFSLGIGLDFILAIFFFLSPFQSLLCSSCPPRLQIWNLTASREQRISNTKNFTEIWNRNLWGKNQTEIWIWTTAGTKSGQLQRLKTDF